MSGRSSGLKRQRANSVESENDSVDELRAPQIEAIIGHCFVPDSAVVRAFSSLNDANFVRYEVRWTGHELTTCETWHTLFDWNGLGAIEAYWLHMSQDPRRDAEQSWAKATAKMRALEATPSENAYFKTLPKATQEHFPMAFLNRTVPSVLQTIAVLNKSNIGSDAIDGKAQQHQHPSTDDRPSRLSKAEPSKRPARIGQRPMPGKAQKVDELQRLPTSDTGRRCREPMRPSWRGPQPILGKEPANRRVDDEPQSSQAESSGKEIDWKDPIQVRRKNVRQYGRRTSKWLSHRPEEQRIYRQRRNNNWNSWTARNPIRYGKILERKLKAMEAKSAAAKQAKRSNN